MEFCRMRIRVINIRVRANRDKHLRAVLREDDVSCPVAAAAQAPAPRKVGKLLGGATGFHVAILVGEAHHGISVADIDPLGILPGGIERNPEGLAQSIGEFLYLLRFAVSADSAEDHNLIAGTHGY